MTDKPAAYPGGNPSGELPGQQPLTGDFGYDGGADHDPYDEADYDPDYPDPAHTPPEPDPAGDGDVVDPADPAQPPGGGDPGELPGEIPEAPAQLPDPEEDG
jgi:hypothetical protein